MSRRFHISGRRVVAIDPLTKYEERARAKYLDVRAIKGSDGYLVPDHVFYGAKRVPPKLSSAELRRAADAALLAEMEASLKEPKKC